MAYLRALGTSIKTLGGVGPASAKAYAELGINTYSDLLLSSPRAWEDRSKIRPLGGIQEGEMANTLVEVLAHTYFGQRSAKKRTLKILLRDASGHGDGRLSLLCFGRNFLEKTIKVGNLYYIYAQVSLNRGELQSSQFELQRATEDGDFPSSFGANLPIYPLRGSLTQRLIRANVQKVLDSVEMFEEELHHDLIAEQGLIPLDEAIRAWHFPPSLAKHEEARKTLALDELFYLQLIARRRKGLQQGEIRLRAANPTKIELALIESLAKDYSWDACSI